MPLIDSAGAQLRLILKIESRDTPKRLVLAGVACVLVATFGSWTLAAMVAFIVLLVEAGFFVCMKSLPPKNAPPPRALTLTYIVISCLSSAGYCVPGIILMAQPSSAAQIIGVFWLSGCMTHSLAANGIAVVIGWVGLALQILCLATGVVFLNTEPRDSMTVYEYVIVAASAVIFCWNFLNAMKAQSANRKAFGEARAQADDRLRQLDFLANHDVLTGLLNRRAFVQALGDALLIPDPAIPIAVAMFDLDDFKPVNDRYGHAAGDSVLRAVARRLDAHPETTCACRLGGDEFVAIIHGYEGETLNLVIQDIARHLVKPIEFDGVHFKIVASGGAAVARPDITISELLAKADQEMYGQKQIRTTTS